MIGIESGKHFACAAFVRTTVVTIIPSPLQRLHGFGYNGIVRIHLSTWLVLQLEGSVHSVPRDVTLPAGAVCSCETAFAPDRELRDATRCAPRSAGAAGRAVTCCSFLGPLQGSPSCRHLDHCSFCFACDSVPSFAKLALVAGKLQPNYRQRCWWNLPPAACVPPIQNWRPAPAPELFPKVMRLTHD